jgi:hypothetical protein
MMTMKQGIALSMMRVMRLVRRTMSIPANPTKRKVQKATGVAAADIHCAPRLRS